MTLPRAGGFGTLSSWGDSVPSAHDECGRGGRGGGECDAGGCISDVEAPRDCFWPAYGLRQPSEEDAAPCCR